jgi:hypothetical protein
MPPSEKPYKLGFTLGHYDPALKTRVVQNFIERRIEQ